MRKLSKPKEKTIVRISKGDEKCPLRKKKKQKNKKQKIKVKGKLKKGKVKKIIEVTVITPQFRAEILINAPLE